MTYHPIPPGSFTNNVYESRKRKPFFTETETMFLMEQFEKHKHVLTSKYATIEINKRKNEIWGDITKGLFLRNPNVKRTIREVKKKWKNIVSMAKREVAKFSECPNSGSKQISDISQRVLCLFDSLPSMQMYEAESAGADLSQMRGYYDSYRDGEGGSNNHPGSSDRLGSADLFQYIKTENRLDTPSENSEASNDFAEDREDVYPDAASMLSSGLSGAAVARHENLTPVIKCETKSPVLLVSENNSEEEEEDEDEDVEESRMRSPDGGGGGGIPSTETAAVVLSACKNSGSPNNGPACGDGAKDCQEPAEKKFKAVSSEYLELQHSVLLLEKEKLQLEIEKMKREMLNQEKMSEMLDIAKDVLITLREKL